MTAALRTAALVRRGFEAVGCSVPATVEDGALIVRNLIVEFDGAINCVEADTDGASRQVFRMHIEAIEAAACAIVMDILSGIVTRAVERAGLERGSGAIED